MDQIEVHFTIKGQFKESVFIPITQKDGTVWLSSADEKGNSAKFELLKDSNTSVFKLKDGSPFEESQDIIDDRLAELSEAWLSLSAQGVESVDSSEAENHLPGYAPDQIFVENKPFSLRQIIDLIHNNDIELSPNFQRHFIWDKTRQSRLIESILLGLPLPSVYFSQYDDGRLTVVDGLQRLCTIRSFLEDKLVLSNLEYLKEYEGKNFSKLKATMQPLRLRRFDQTQILCFVIDYRSPAKLKFDLFRRLNTGGKPLNNQEIRNCLSRPHLQNILQAMTTSEAFKQATDCSLKDTRMEAQEAALRFICFYRTYDNANTCGSYDGKMDDTLDSCVNELNKLPETELKPYLPLYEKSLNMAFQLFGNLAFRKVSRKEPNRRNPINKLLMMCTTVLLAKFHDDYAPKVSSGITLTDVLAQLIDEDDKLFESLTFGTNGKSNIDNVFRTLKGKLFDPHLL